MKNHFKNKLLYYIMSLEVDGKSFQRILYFIILVQFNKSLVLKGFCIYLFLILGIAG